MHVTATTTKSMHTFMHITINTKLYCGYAVHMYPLLFILIPISFCGRATLFSDADLLRLPPSSRSPSCSSFSALPLECLFIHINTNNIVGNIHNIKLQNKDLTANYAAHWARFGLTVDFAVRPAHWSLVRNSFGTFAVPLSASPACDWTRWVGPQRSSDHPATNWPRRRPSFSWGHRERPFPVRSSASVLGFWSRVSWVAAWAVDRCSPPSGRWKGCSVRRVGLFKLWN